jgi:uncharacterized membrane protein YeaQ/YmgE (transglycosylase-associated protein family)
MTPPDPPPTIVLSQFGDAAPAVQAHITAKDRRPMSPRLRKIIPTLLVGLSVLTFSQLVALWPAVLNAMPDVARPASAGGNAVLTTPEAIQSTLLLGLWHPRFHPEVAVLLMVVIAGLLGALIGTGRKFQRWAHLDQLTERDQWSYVLLPLQGALLAIVVYFTFRGGFLGTGSGTPLNPYGIAAVAGIVGLFTDNAMHKLRQIMDTLFGQPTQPEIDAEGGRENGQTAPPDPPRGPTKARVTKRPPTNPRPS